MKKAIPSRGRMLIAGIILAFAITFIPSPARAGWAFSVTSPSGYFIIGSGGVAVGVAVVIGYFYIWGEARSLALQPPARVGLLDNPADTKDKSQAFSPRLDLLSYSF
ncbi:MAG: hypothetical protein PHE84_07125 [bacterium]|nr:hypothetical protein [bacterium]